MTNPARLLIAAVLLHAVAARAADRPNILWLTSEDHGQQMGCYGDTLARTPNVDALASKGMVFRHAWSNHPVCAPSRTAIISGLYSQSSGGLHMRSMVPAPAGFKLYPQHLREAGYYVTNNSKTDYNLRAPGGLWNESSAQAHWKNRPAGQPFFAIFNSTKSHESQIRTRPHQAITDPAKVRVPAYHPDTPEVRQDWAQYYDKVSEADADAGARLREVAAAGLSEETIVFYYGDHGSGMPRSKRWPSDSGLRVPMVVYFPQKWRHLAPKEYTPGGKSDRLVSFVDLAPTLLSLAGVRPPPELQGHAFAGKFQTEPQPYLHGARGRMDERVDCVRSVTDGRFVYLRNFYPHVSQGQRVNYQFQTPTTRVWRAAFDAGQATPAQALFWQVPKAPEELYDLQSDPDEVKNLADSPAHRATLEKLRAAMRAHAESIRDVGFLPEGEMHTRAPGTAPYDLARDPAKYPFARILDTADLASNLTPAAVPELRRRTTDTDSAVRHWAALGLLMRGKAAISSGQPELRALLQDSSPLVRIVAAEALTAHGTETDSAPALAILKDYASVEKYGVFVAMAALNAIEALGPKAASLKPYLAELSPKGPSPDNRYDSYVPRQLASLTGKEIADPEEAPAPKARGKGKRKAGEKED
jgi:uncharacterized sulfatase